MIQRLAILIDVAWYLHIQIVLKLKFDNSLRKTTFRKGEEGPLPWLSTMR
jgi:hypothetical protein